MTNGISVIIRNKNEADYIGFAIQSVLDHIGTESVEIIIVDNESTDDSMSVVSLFNDRIPIVTTSISNKEYSPGLSLNRGIQLAKYDITLILSAHCQITKLPSNIREDIIRIGTGSTKPIYGAVFGKQIPIYRGKKISRRYIWENFSDRGIVNMISKSENRPFLHNAFCFYKTEIVKKFDFDENLSGKEDRYWAKDYLSDGGYILYNVEMECNHFYTKNGATWKGIGTLIPLFITISQFLQYFLI